ncbi:MAG TPA: biopolymer transporter ExbD [Myxococcaceae bacterium]|nr:biopolymer transporter ExbD [Myxococcaceae bacterium]
MSMTAGGKGGIKSDINVTPLVDVVLVLLIIFMVVTPMLQRGKDVKLPTAVKQKNSAEDKSQDPMIVSVTADKQIWLEKDPMTDDALKQALGGKLAAEPWKPILVKGDQSLTFGDVRRVLKDAQDAKAKSVKLGVEEK